MKFTKSVFFIFVVMLSMFLCYSIVSLSRQNQDRKIDYAEINNIKYGLFSVNQWKLQLTDIIDEEIAGLDLNWNKGSVKPVIEAQLLSLIDSVDRRLREKNIKTFKGRFKQAMISSFVDIKDIKKGVPNYADEIIKVMEKPKNKRRLKDALLERVGDYFDKTFEVQDQNKISAVVQRVGAEDIEMAKIKINQEIADNQVQLNLLSWSLILVAIAAFVIAGLGKNVLSSPQYVLLVTILFLLLVAGVTTPMIDLEAKISEMKFVLMDHPIVFMNQVLYFQTKSIIDVFRLMISHKDLQMKFVGILIITFSIIFPVTKLISSMAYYYNPWNKRDNKWVQFFVLKSGKWSMSDVMIIAIFMAYIGFNGIIESQFGELKGAAGDLVVLTTNGTALQPGFYLFFSYAILAMFLTEFLTKRRAFEAANETKNSKTILSTPVLSNS
jgi:hypothetical protein